MTLPCRSRCRSAAAKKIASIGVPAQSPHLPRAIRRSRLLRRLPARARRVNAGGVTVAMVPTIEVILSDIEAGLEHVFCFASFCVSDV